MPKNTTLFLSISVLDSVVWFFDKFRAVWDADLFIRVLTEAEELYKMESANLDEYEYPNCNPNRKEQHQK